MSATETVDRDLERPPAKARGGRPLRGGGFLLSFASVAVAVAAWEVAVRALAIPSYLLPAPSVVVTSLWERRSMLLENLQSTAAGSGLGLALAIVAGVVLAAIIAEWRAADRVVYPWLVAGHVIPKIAIAPLVVVWFGFGFTSKTLFVFIFCIFPIVVNTVTGLRAAPPALLQLVRSMGGGRGQIFWRIKLPWAMPTIFAGLKLAVALAPTGAVVGEFVGSNEGLGHVLLVSTGNLDTSVAFATVVVISLFGLITWYATEYLERLAIPWHASQRK